MIRIIKISELVFFPPYLKRPKHFCNWLFSGGWYHGTTYALVHFSLLLPILSVDFEMFLRSGNVKCSNKCLSLCTVCLLWTKIAEPDVFLFFWIEAFFRVAVWNHQNGWPSRNQKLRALANRPPIWPLPPAPLNFWCLMWLLRQSKRNLLTMPTILIAPFLMCLT